MNAEYTHTRGKWTNQEDNFLRRWWNLEPPSWDGWVRLMRWHTWPDVCHRATVIGLEGGDESFWLEEEDEYLRFQLVAIAKKLGKTYEEVLQHARNMV